MTYDSFLSDPAERAAYVRLFEALAGHNLLLAANPPLFTILAASPQRLHDVGMTKEDVIGRPLFEAHPGNPSDPTDNGVSNLRSSLDHVLRYKEIHHLPIQRYDLPNDDGVFTEKYWRASNQPVFNDEGEIAYIIHTAEDITAQIKSAQREIHMEGVEKVFSLFMHAPIVVGIVNGTDYVLELANEAAFELWGKGPQEIIGKPILEGLPELAGQGIIELFDQVRSSGKPFIAQEVPVTSLANGRKELHYFNLVYQPYYDKNSEEVTGVFTISHDVTEQVTARKRMEESEEALRAAMEETERQKRLYETITSNTPDLIYVFDLNYRFTYANEALLTMWGKTWDQAIGKGLPENGYEPWHTEMHHREIDQVVTTKKPIRGEVHFPHATLGKRLYDYIFVPVLDENGEVEAIAGTTRDITEIKQAEDAIRKSELQLRTMILQAPVAMCILLGPTYVINIANEAMINLWGKPREQVMNKPVFEALPDAAGQGLEGVMQEVYRTGDPFYANERPVELLRGGKWETVYQNFVYQAYRDGDGEIVGVITISVDVTEQVLARKKLEESEADLQLRVEERTLELENKNKELNRSNQNLEEFAHAASHDLKEPVRKIHFYTHQLKDQLSIHLQEEEIRSFHRIENATQRMNNLIDDLLLYSHVSQRPHELETIDLNQKMQNVLEDLELDIEEKKATIQVEKLPVVRGNRRQLQQLFQNLLSNALKYSKKNVPPQIIIAADQLTQNDKVYHRIAIKDNGIGFEQQYAEKIFQMFARLHGKAEYSGTGVGLSIVKKVVENHNGFIEVESKVGLGSMFKVYLPV
ncbi:PAS domain-containing protein [Flavisolibacter ginsenosidimutans]|uniref:histidine kinase n=1 Tax=Flavisolibacter ginsenosidimutans TaxID=661481 RepID=A0A5B8UHS9_9BACT|nr:PAS domain-containing protein [Flavisolibacter ginsenosidimutans]QEC55699.1 PAS domain S-box protein [Flavisolibacter ginsenosidimutans]